MENMRRQIASETYNREFFLSEHLEGYDEYRRGDLSVVKAKQLDLLDIGPGMSVLEIGFGRAELLLHCAARGAKVTGVDYAEAACPIARATLAQYPDSDIRVADARHLPFADDTFDRAFSGDVLEHMDFTDAIAKLREMYRVVKPGGFLLVKTTPNTVFVRWIYPLARPVLRLIDRAGVAKLDEQLRLMRVLHLDEYNLFSLRRVARQAGLQNAQVWIDPDLARSHKHRYSESFSSSRLIRLVDACGRFWIVRFFLGNDLYLKCVK